MAVDQEECFPRGQSTTKKPALRKIKTSLFDAGLGNLSKEIKKFKVQKSSKKKLKKIKKKKKEKKVIGKILPLTYQDCPSLASLFREGQPVVCRVGGVTREGGRASVCVTASLEPARINAALRHDTVRAGQPIAAAVGARQDHGYSMHTGVLGLTAFLPNAQVAAYNRGALEVGEVLLCTVKKSKTGRDCSQVKLMLASNLESQPETGLPSVLLPGTPVRCVVKQRVPGGLVVSVGSILGLIEAAQFRDCWFDTKEFKQGRPLNATVLYVSENDDDGNPKTVYLTLKDIHRETIPKLPLGQIINAEVTSANYRGIYLCLGDEMDNSLGNKGMVSKHRVGDPVKTENLRKYYPKGTRLTTRVLAYDYMEEVYNCTLEKSKLSEQYVRADEVNVGDRLLATVSDVQPQMVLLAVGSVKMAVFKEHSADVPYKELSAHFNKADVVRARVLRASGGKQLVATLKPTLLRGPALTSYAQARVGDAYWGTVRHVRELSLLIGFFADVTGILSLNKPRAFRTHQLVRCRITYVNPSDRKLTLSLESSEEERKKQLEVGEQCELEVTGETQEHYTVVPFDHDCIDGILPKSHLPGQVLYCTGQSLKASLYCKAGSVYYFSNNPAIQNFFTNDDKLETSDSVTCCVGKVDLNSKWIDIFTPHPSVFKCPRKHILANGNLMTYQIIQLPKKIIQKYNKLNEECTEDLKQEAGETNQEVQAKKQTGRNRNKITSEIQSDDLLNSGCEEDQEYHENIKSSQYEDIKTSVAIKDFKKKYEKKLHEALGSAVPSISVAESDSDSEGVSVDEFWPVYQKRNPIDFEIDLEFGLVSKNHESVGSQNVKDKKNKNKRNIAKILVSASEQEEELLTATPKTPDLSKRRKHGGSFTTDFSYEDFSTKKRKVA